MIKEQLKDSELIAYRSLLNALQNSKVAHSYLFSGEYNPLKIEAAYLLAESIIEGKNDFACETCDTCKRIRANKYFDVIFVDGYERSIRKDDVENILDEFSRTSLETSGKKVYILANINNASVKVLNMILKFMEEPSSSNTFGIFITDRKDDLLPTIVSRCQEVPFLTRDFSFLIEKYVDRGFDPTDAYLLSAIFHRFDPEFDLNDPVYLGAKEYVFKTIETLDEKDYLPVLFYREFYSLFKERDDFRKLVDMYLSIMIVMINDALQHRQLDDEQYNFYLRMIEAHKPGKLLQIFVDAGDKAARNAERKLLFDAISYEIISYI
ncbi:MAG: DNA polymerase III subunit [Erysipelotrichaceae bacterium]|nr:DNA polymerase III subunit [Erysipelotrichaceae bacterium]